MSLLSRLPQVRGKYRENALLAKICWFGVGGSAEVLFIPEDSEDLIHFIKNKPEDIKIRILGVGSNLLIRDNIIEGVTIRLGRGFNYIRHDNYQIISGASVLDLNLAQYAASYAIAGLEFFAGIPGTVGGALAMNAGAYGSETANVLIYATAVNRISGQVKIFKTEEIGYFYRGKALSSEWIFIEATFKGSEGKSEDIIKKIQEIQSARSETQPVRSKTGGSTFKNPESKKAWQLIDEAGCRGLTIGGAQVSPMHCNFLINLGNATSSDLENLIKEVKSRVYEKSGIELEEEIKIWG